MVARKIAKRGAVKAPKKKAAPQKPKKSQKKAAPRMKKNKEPVGMQQLFRKPQGHLFDKSLEETRQARASAPVECLGMSFPNDDARREYFLKKLEAQLKDPEFRKIDGFPIGEDEDILRLSDPPYYTACPNPFLSDFFRLEATPYDPAKPYSKEPFAADVKEGKNDPIYNAHSYHTKVPHQAIMQYILHYTEPGDVVLDAFCGSGMTGVAAELCGRPDDRFRQMITDATSDIRWGARRAILCDLGPVTSLIAHNYNVPFDVPYEVKQAETLLSSIETEIGWAFNTAHTGWDSSDRTSGGRRNSVQRSPAHGVINFVIWSDVFICPECSTELDYWNVAADPDTASVRDTFPCPRCRSTLSKDNMQRAIEAHFDSILGRTVSQRKQVPVLINYSVGHSRYEKTPDPEDLATLKSSETLLISGRVPDQEFMLKGERWGDTWRAGYHYGFTNAHHFYTRRNLAVLSRVWQEAMRTRSPFLQFLFTSTHAWTTRMNRLLVSNYFKKRGGVIGQTLSGTMYVSSIAVETNAIVRFRCASKAHATRHSRVRWPYQPNRRQT